jgi:hypothetical protein
LKLLTKSSLVLACLKWTPVFNFSRTWRFVFNHRKSNVVGFGSSRAVKVVDETSWSLGGGSIAAAVSYKYLGVEFCSSGRWDEFLKRILAKAKSATNLLAWKIRVRGYVASRVVGPSASSAMSLWCAMCPILEYAAEIWEGADF